MLLKNRLHFKRRKVHEKQHSIRKGKNGEIFDGGNQTRDLLHDKQVRVTRALPNIDLD
jgi:hypothetical protein